MTGWLYFGQDTRKYYPQTCARLFKDSKSEVDVIAPIEHAHVRHIKGGGMMINGCRTAPATKNSCDRHGGCCRRPRRLDCEIAVVGARRIG